MTVATVEIWLTFRADISVRIDDIDKPFGGWNNQDLNFWFWPLNLPLTVFWISKIQILKKTIFHNRCYNFSQNQNLSSSTDQGWCGRVQRAPERALQSTRTGIIRNYIQINEMTVATGGLT